MGGHAHCRLVRGHYCVFDLGAAVDCHPRWQLRSGSNLGCVTIFSESSSVVDVATGLVGKRTMKIDQQREC